MRIFVTGASGFVGSALVAELIGAGHSVVGLARSDASAEKLAAAGAEVHRGSLEDIESLKRGASGSDGVVHCAFIHDVSKFAENSAIDKRAIDALGGTLEVFGKPLIATIAAICGRSAAADRCQNEDISARLKRGVESCALSTDKDVDVAPDCRRRVAKTLAHARPARFKLVHHVRDRLRLNHHHALGVRKERCQQGRQPHDSGRTHQDAVIVSTDEIAGKSRAMHAQVSPSSWLA